MSRKMLFALAGVAVLLAGSPAWKADAAAPIGVSSLPPLVHSSSPVETARCVCGPRGCACGRAWRRGYWGRGPGWGWGPRRCWWRGGVRVCRW
jgi:hypothetical protein